MARRIAAAVAALTLLLVAAPTASAGWTWGDDPDSLCWPCAE